jgi:tetratricopeptide (TPR) repeat protein
MSIETDFSFETTLTNWLNSEEASHLQKSLEEKITHFLFGLDLSSHAFQKMAIQLAWIGSCLDFYLEREIIALNQLLETEPCGWLKDRWNNVTELSKKVGDFVSDHATEIGIGIAISATAIAISSATGYPLSATVGGVIVAGAGSIFRTEEKPNPHIPPIPLPDPRACSKEEFNILQQTIPASVPKLELPPSIHELFVTAEGIWANGQFYSNQNLLKHSPTSKVLENSVFSFHSTDSEWRTFAYYNYLTEQLGDKSLLSHQKRGESALALGNYQQAVQDLGRAIEVTATHALPYLQRGAALFELGDYEASLETYNKLPSNAAPTYSLYEFALGFTQGLPKGSYESGKGLLLFLVDFVNHPLQTSRQVYDTFTTLVQLAHQDNWTTLAETFIPEIHQFVTEWDTLSPSQRGELAGYVLGKYGADILIPGTLTKIASKGVKSAQELAAVCKNLQLAQETLLFEAACGIGNSIKIAEIVKAGQNTAFFAEELGYTAEEIGRLKQTRQLETAVTKRYEQLSTALQETCDFYKEAEKSLKPYSKKALPESRVRELIHQTGMTTFPRPKGIPDDFLVMITDKGAGMLYVHPTLTHIRVRVMPGKPHSPFPHQQKPYVIQQIDGKAVDILGNCVLPNTPEAHIPLSEFNFRSIIK